MASIKALVRDQVRHDLEQSPLEVNYGSYHELLYHTQQIWNRVYSSVGLEKTQLNLVYARHLIELLERFPEQASNDIEVKALTALGNYCTSMAESAPNLTARERIEYSLSALDCFRARNNLMPLNSTSLTLVRVALQIYLNSLTELRAEQGSFGFSDIAEEADDALEPYHTLILLTANNRQNLRNNLLFDFFRARARILLAQGRHADYKNLFAEARNYIDPMLLNPERRNTWNSYRLEGELERQSNANFDPAPAPSTTTNALASITRPLTPPDPGEQPSVAAPSEADDTSQSDEDEADELAHLGPVRTPQAWLEHKMTPNDPQRSTNVPYQLFPFIQGGIDMYKTGDYSGALDQFKQAEMLNPNPAFRHVILYNQAATLLALSGQEQSKLAEQLLEQAVTMGSRLPGLRWNLAVAYWRNHGVDRRLIATLNEVVDAGRKAPLCAAAAAHMLGDPLGVLGALLRAKALPGSLPDIDAEMGKLVEDFPSIAPQVSAEQARFAARYQQQVRYPSPTRPPEQPYQRPAYNNPPPPAPRPNYPQGGYPQPNYQPDYQQPNQYPSEQGYQPSRQPYVEQQPYQQPPNYQQPRQPYGQEQQPGYQRPNYPQPQPNYQQPRPPYGQEQQPGYQRPNYQPRTYTPNSGPGQGSYSPNAYGQGYPQRNPYPAPDYNPQRNPGQPQPYQPAQPAPQPDAYPQRPRYNPPPSPPQPAPQGSNLARLASVIALYEGLLDQINALLNPDLSAEERQRYQLELTRSLSRIERHSRETLTTDEAALLNSWFNKWRTLSDALAHQAQHDEPIEVKPAQTHISNAPTPSGLVLAVTNRSEQAARNLELRLPPRPDTYELPYFADAERGEVVGLDRLEPGATSYLRLLLTPRRYGSLDITLELSYYEGDASDEEANAAPRRSYIMLQPNPLTAKFEPLPTVYLAGEAIPPDRTDIFKGRAEEIVKIKASLGLGDDLPRAQSAIPYLTGIGKVGKSSLLNHLANANAHPDLHDALLPVHISMDEYQSDEYKLSTFLAAIATKINDALRLAGRAPAPIDQQGLREQPLITFFDGYLAAVNDSLKPRRLLLMFDEFRYLADKVKRGEWEAAFLSKLRTLYQQGQICLVFAGRGAFNEITRGLNEPSLLDSVRDHPLSFLSTQAVSELIREPSAKRGINFLPEAVTLISWLTAGHPFFVQYICHDAISEILNRERRTVVTPEDVASLKQLYLQSDNLFSHLWNGEMRELHQDVVFTLLGLQPQPGAFVGRQMLVEALPDVDGREVAGVIEQLCRREVLEDGSSAGQPGVRVRIPLLYEWFRTKHERGLSLSPFSRLDHLNDIKSLTMQALKLRKNINRAASEPVFKEGVFDENNSNQLLDTYAEDWTAFHRFVDTLYKSIGHEAIVARDFLREVPRFFDVVRDLQYIRNGIVAHRPDNEAFPDSADAAYNIIDKYLGHQPGKATDFLELQEALLRVAIAGLNELHEVVARQ